VQAKLASDLLALAGSTDQHPLIRAGAFAAALATVKAFQAARAEAIGGGGDGGALLRTALGLLELAGSDAAAAGGEGPPAGGGGAEAGSAAGGGRAAPEAEAGTAAGGGTCAPAAEEAQAAAGASGAGGAGSGSMADPMLRLRVLHGAVSAVYLVLLDVTHGELSAAVRAEPGEVAAAQRAGAKALGGGATAYLLAHALRRACELRGARAAFLVADAPAAGGGGEGEGVGAGRGDGAAEEGAEAEAASAQEAADAKLLGQAYGTWEKHWAHYLRCAYATDQLPRLAAEVVALSGAALELLAAAAAAAEGPGARHPMDWALLEGVLAELAGCESEPLLAATGRRLQAAAAAAAATEGGAAASQHAAGLLLGEEQHWQLVSRLFPRRCSYCSAAEQRQATQLLRCGACKKALYCRCGSLVGCRVGWQGSGGMRGREAGQGGIVLQVQCLGWVQGRPWCMAAGLRRARGWQQRAGMRPPLPRCLWCCAVHPARRLLGRTATSRHVQP
jgi:hypothetical protein